MLIVLLYFSKDLVARYIIMPGQALSYRMGQLKLEKLRQRAEAKLGEAFQLAKFHRAIFQCYGTLDLMEECVHHSYINVF